MPPARGTPPKPPAQVVSTEPPPVLREFRGVWVASVANIDWPSKRTLSTAEQQTELLTLLDRAAELKLNAVIFQVRPAADALYESSIEPWSEYLTGAQGRRPDPFWDPLSFVIREAHARGMELHAWFNPYRARHTDARSPLTKTHIARTNPALVKPYAGYLWMDPGEPAVRARTLRVVLDVVKRYDIDGVHIDDYFYPYPETDRRGRPILFPDATSWTRYQKSGGKLSRADWRRENVNKLVEELHEGIHKTKPWVRFGISPFGIWRPGYPEQIRGLDAYERLYADARKWLHEGWLDYFTPQLYWPTTSRAQSYPVLLDWWASENRKSRHLWPGNFTSRAGGRGTGAFSVSELMEQIRVTRLNPAASGNVHFSMKSFLINQASMNDTLRADAYTALALPPASPWLVTAAPPAPVVKLAQNGGLWRITLGPEGRAAPWQWMIRLRTDSAWITMMLPGSTTQWTVPPTLGANTIAVTSINRVGTEGSTVTLPLVLSPGSSPAGTSAPSPARSGRRDVR
ncbi:MAG TPA: family 10 glycosylhydrolase [Gemmatimonas sp.]|uniref:glycoside hydrolase family 10 protein n=1 Tax=Gemmatimonas sp. TaxID=1962908 RepID=UPI002EDA7559